MSRSTRCWRNSLDSCIWSIKHDVCSQNAGASAGNVGEGMPSWDAVIHSVRFVVSVLTWACMYMSCCSLEMKCSHFLSIFYRSFCCPSSRCKLLHQVRGTFSQPVSSRAGLLCCGSRSGTVVRASLYKYACIAYCGQIESHDGTSQSCVFVVLARLHRTRAHLVPRGRLFPLLSCYTVIVQHGAVQGSTALCRRALDNSGLRCFEVGFLLSAEYFLFHVKVLRVQRINYKA